MILSKYQMYNYYNKIKLIKDFYLKLSLKITINNNKKL